MVNNLLPLREIEKLPGFDASSFPELPVVDLQGGLFYPHHSPWPTLGHNLAAAAIISACIDRGYWWPLTVWELEAYLGRSIFFLTSLPAIISAQQQMILVGEIERLCYQGQVFVSPTQSLARKVLVESQPNIYPGLFRQVIT